MAGKGDRAILSNTLSQGFAREITLVDTLAYHGDFTKALYHGLIADVIHETLMDFEEQRQQWKTRPHTYQHHHLLFLFEWQ